MSYILVTGGAGYIGSHVCFELNKRDIKNIIIIDNFSKSKEQMYSILKKEIPTIEIYNFDLVNKELVRNVFKKYNIEKVIHLAALKSVGESIQNPFLYYNNNISVTINLLEIMDEFNCRNFIFSSSATVYGNQTTVPIKECASTYEKQTNPYGTSKLIIEMILRDLSNKGNKWNIIILRYFNPVGSHCSFLIGENPLDIPNNLMPRIVRVASGLDEQVFVFGGDYPTLDGTCERDYIHVEDLADGHLAALDHLEEQKLPVDFFNLGTGRSSSVLELISAFEEATGRKVPTVITERRVGDTPICYADVTKSKERLGWEAKKSLNEMCLSSWQYHSSHLNDV